MNRPNRQDIPFPDARKYSHIDVASAHNQPHPELLIDVGAWYGRGKGANLSSKRRRRRSACEGKRKYLTSADATAAAAVLTKSSGQKVVPYRCPFCRRWHIGHPPIWVQRRLGYRD